MHKKAIQPALVKIGDQSLSTRHVACIVHDLFYRCDEERRDVLLHLYVVRATHSTFMGSNTDNLNWSTQLLAVASQQHGTFSLPNTSRTDSPQGRSPSFKKETKIGLYFRNRIYKEACPSRETAQRTLPEFVLMKKCVVVFQGEHD